MTAPLDVSGQRYGNLVAIERVRDGGRHTKWKFICDCGQETITYLDFVRRGVTKSCGCQSSRNTIGQRSTTHGHSTGRNKSRTLNAWHNAKNRCSNQNNERFYRYGGRGISMCQQWHDDFAAFLHDMGECPPNMTLERIDLDQGYQLGNCRWATMHEQMRNTSRNVFVDFDGERMILKDFAARVGVNYTNLHFRIKKHDETPIQAAEWLKSKAERKARPRQVAQNKGHLRSR